MQPSTVNSPTNLLQKRWRKLQQEPGDLRPIRIALTASFTVEPLLPYLGYSLAERRLFSRFTVAPFNQIYQSLIDPGSAVRAAGADVTVVLPRTEELCARSLHRLALLEPAAVEAARTEAHAEIDRLAQALARFTEASAGTVLCGTLPPPANTPLGLLDASHPASLRHLTRELNLRLWGAALWTPRLRLFDVDEAVAHLGAERAWDPRMSYLAGCPYSAALLRLLGERLACSIAALVVAPAKVVVVDLDNTLWGGILGEDGAAGLALGDSGLGAAFVAFQEALLALRAQGVLLCVASKNNEAEAFAVIDRHPGMRLRREHFSAHRISWQSKSESLRQISRELSLGLDSFVFIDDSRAEREEVRLLLPEVTVLDLPPDPARYVEALRATPAFDRMALTEADSRRAELYHVEQARATARAAVPASDPEALGRYLRSLELRAVVRRLAESDIPRAAQLTQKTNQFNLTTVRRTEAELTAMRRASHHRLYTIEVADRLGDYGLTGLVVVERTAEDTWDLDTMLLSCRVLGRGVESALLRTVISDLVRADARRLTGRFLRTEKNEPARDFLPRHGFVERAGGQWVKEGLPGPAFPDDHVAVQLAFEEQA
jgi:FkbH-like protein